MISAHDRPPDRDGRVLSCHRTATGVTIYLQSRSGSIQVYTFSCDSEVSLLATVPPGRPESWTPKP